MNKKIRDLQIQAFAECKTFEDNKVRTDDVFERFAELIVRECAFYLENEYGKSVITGNDAADFIRKHFGVENA